MQIPWHGQIPPESRIFKYTIYLISVWFFLLILINILAIYFKQPILLWRSTLVFAPATILMLTVYFEFKRFDERLRAKQLSEIIHKSSHFLGNPIPDINNFDKFLSTDIENLKRGPVSLYIYSTLIFLDFARVLIVKEHENAIQANAKHKHDKKYAAVEFPYRELHRDFEKIEYFVLILDRVGTFDAFGYIFTKLLLLRRKFYREQLGEFTKDGFIESCESISDSLKIRLFNEAYSESLDLLNSIRLQKIPGDIDYSLIGWQSLITYWIWIRIEYIKHLSIDERRTIWLGPSKILANQIDAAIQYYQFGNYRGVVDLIITSFDWRLRIPKVIFSGIRFTRH